jgi:hypothetical protein
MWASVGKSVSYPQPYPQKYPVSTGSKRNQAEAKKEETP